MQPPLLTLQNIELTFGGTPLFEGADLAIQRGDRLCLVGRNGSGKSTLLKIAANLVEADAGERFIQPGCTWRYLPQEPDLTAYPTVLAYVEDGLTEGDDPYRASYMLEELGVAPDTETSHLSGGEARRAALARTLAPEPDVIMLDEPTNHLDLPAIEWLEREIATLSSAVVVISHDRRFLETTSRRTAWIDRGQTRELNKGFAHFEDWRDELLEQEELDRHKLDRKIARENHWVIHGVSGRRKRNVRRLADLDTLRSEKQKMAERSQRAHAKAEMNAQESSASGKRVMEAFEISKGYDERTLVRDFSLKVQRGERIGLVGPNGAGKTTLLNMLVGTLAPDSGTVVLGQNLEMVTLDQKRESLNPADTLKEALTGDGSDMVSVGGVPRHVISYMKDFLFAPEQARSPIEALSGGERARVMLARAFARPSNLMVLDEPTNDLDLETLDLLQELIADYSGTVLLVSHDRDFLDRVVTRVVNFEGDANWIVYAGGFSDMQVQRKAARKDAASQKQSGSKSQKAPTGGDTKARTSNKMTFKDKHALETLPAEIERLENEIRTLQAKLDDPDLFSRDPDTFNATVATLTAADTAKVEAEERWLELEMQREELDSAS